MLRADLEDHIPEVGDVLDLHVAGAGGVPAQAADEELLAAEGGGVADLLEEVEMAVGVAGLAVGGVLEQAGDLWVAGSRAPKGSSKGLRGSL